MVDARRQPLVRPVAPRPRLLCRDHPGHGAVGVLLVRRVLQGKRLIEGLQAGVVAEHVRDGHALLAVLGELGPDRGHRVVVLEQALVGGQRKHGGGERFG